MPQLQDRLPSPVAGHPSDRAHHSPLTTHHFYRADVFNTFTCRNRATGQPWLTALDWPGSPLPSLKLPWISYVLSPPRPSQEPQKSVVRDWYATSRNMPVTLPRFTSQNVCPPNWKLYRW